MGVDCRVITVLRNGRSISKLINRLYILHAVDGKGVGCLHCIRLGLLSTYLFDALCKVECSNGECLYSFCNCLHSPLESLIGHIEID
jgi:hypothetical protein